MKNQILRFHKSLGSPRSFTTAPGANANVWRCRHGGRTLRARGSPLLRSVLAVALAALGLQVTCAAASYRVIHSFGYADDGYYPYAGLVEGHDGKLYGTTPVGGSDAGGNVFRINPNATGYTYEVITNFPAGLSGKTPYAGLVLGRDGALYGQTCNGSTNGYGAVFKLEFNPVTGWACSAVHSFSFSVNAGWGALIEDKQADGVFYGTMQNGGVYSRGAVFSLTNGVGFTVIGSFAYTNGQYPMAALVEGSDHVLYGTTYLGGTNSQGTVFRIEKIRDPLAPIKALHHFPNFPTDGDRLYAALIEGSDGMLYGTAGYGGGLGGGVVFRLNKGDGSGHEVLRTSQGGVDGIHPWQAALVERRDGAMMGVMSAGGTFGHGTIFKLNKNGSDYAVLQSFKGAPTEGSFPNGTLVRARDGAYYGTTMYGGANNLGTIFRWGARGALDGDLDLDADDHAIFRRAYPSRSFDLNYDRDCDYNRDGRVSPRDYMIWYQYWRAGGE